MFIHSCLALATHGSAAEGALYSPGVPLAYVGLKVCVLLTVPALVVTVMGPELAFGGTWVTILVALSVMMGAVVPLKAKAVAWDRLRPLMITVVPGVPDVGVMAVISGVTLVVILPMELLSWLLNHIAPPGPVVISAGPPIPVPG
jgi:hypothetical protein